MHLRGTGPEMSQSTVSRRVPEGMPPERATAQTGSLASSELATTLPGAGAEVHLEGRHRRPDPSMLVWSPNRLFVRTPFDTAPESEARRRYSPKHTWSPPWLSIESSMPTTEQQHSPTSAVLSPRSPVCNLWRESQHSVESVRRYHSPKHTWSPLPQPKLQPQPQLHQDILSAEAHVKLVVESEQASDQHSETHAEYTQLSQDLEAAPTSQCVGGDLSPSGMSLHTHFLNGEKQHIEELQVRLAAALADVQRHQAAKQSAEEALHAKDLDLASVQQMNSREQEKLANVVSAHADEVAKLQAQLATATKETETGAAMLAQAKADAEARIKDLTDELATRGAGVSQELYEQAVSDLTAVKAELNAAAEDKRSDMAMLEQEKADAQAKVKDLSDELAAQAGSVSLELYDKAVSDLETATSAHADEVAKLQAQLATATKETETGAAMLAQEKADAEARIKDAEDKRSDMAMLEQEVADLTGRLSEDNGGSEAPGAQAPVVDQCCGNMAATEELSNGSLVRATSRATDSAKVDTEEATATLNASRDDESVREAAALFEAALASDPTLQAAGSGLQQCRARLARSTKSAEGVPGVAPQDIVKAARIAGDAEALLSTASTAADLDDVRQRFEEALQIDRDSELAKFGLRQAQKELQLLQAQITRMSQTGEKLKEEAQQTRDAKAQVVAKLRQQDNVVKTGGAVALPSAGMGIAVAAQGGAAYGLTAASGAAITGAVSPVVAAIGVQGATAVAIAGAAPEVAVAAGIATVAAPLYIGLKQLGKPVGDDVVVNIGVGCQATAAEMDKLREIGIDSLSVNRKPKMSVYKQAIKFKCTKRDSYAFEDADGNKPYKVTCLRKGTHEVAYNSSNPRIVKVTRF